MRTIVVSALALFATPALAQEGFYVGLGLGNFDYDDPNIVPRILASNVPQLGSISDTASSYKLFGGFELSDYFAVEISFGKTGTVTGAGTTLPPTTSDFGFTIETDYTSTVAKAVGQLPFDRIILFGSLGYFDTDVDLRYQVVSGLPPFGADFAFGDNGLVATVGAEWLLGELDARYGIRVEYEWWDMDPADAATLGVGVSFRF